MCQLCGCTEYIEKGKEAVLGRAAEIISYLSLTPENADDYEETEIISRFIAPFGSVEDDVYQTAAWLGRLHMSQAELGRYERYQAHVHAFRDIFSRLPVKGEPKHIVSTYHQLEQLGRELDDTNLALADPGIRKTIQAVNRVHDDMAAKEVRLRQRYGL